MKKEEIDKIVAQLAKDWRLCVEPEEIEVEGSLRTHTSGTYFVTIERRHGKG